MVIFISESTDTKKQLFTYEHDAGRLELFIRIIYCIPIAIVIWVYAIIALICQFIQLFHILILGSRNEGLSNVIKGYLEYLVNVMSYMWFMTDKRPEIFPVAVKIFKE